jgi:hypothetical protein
MSVYPGVLHRVLILEVLELHHLVKYLVYCLLEIFRVGLKMDVTHLSLPQSPRGVQVSKLPLQPVFLNPLKLLPIFNGFLRRDAVPELYLSRLLLLDHLPF